MTAYYQLGNELNRVPYSGEDCNAVIYEGQHKTVAMPAGPAQNDTLEIPLLEIPAGARISELNWAIGGNLGTNTSAKLVLRKKNTNNIVSPNGSGGVLPAAADKIVQVNGSDSSVTVTSANNSGANVIPTTFEGLATPKSTTQEAYLLGLQVTFGATPTWVTGVDVYVAAKGAFIGTL